MGWDGWWLLMDGREQKVGSRGCEGCFAPHSHPSPPEKKAASRKKSRLRRKKTAPRLFVHFHPTNPTIPPQKKEHSLLVLPSVNTIINFATEFFEMFTKLPSEHPQTVFRVFQVFQVFHFAFGPQNRPVLVQIRTKPEKSVPTHLRHKIGAQNTQKGNPPTRG